MLLMLSLLAQSAFGMGFAGPDATTLVLMQMPDTENGGVITQLGTTVGYGLLNPASVKFADNSGWIEGSVATSGGVLTFVPSEEGAKSFVIGNLTGQAREASYAEGPMSPVQETPARYWSIQFKPIVTLGANNAAWGTARSTSSFTLRMPADLRGAQAPVVDSGFPVCDTVLNPNR